MRKQDKILKIIWWVYIALLLVFVVVKFKGSFYELTDRISTYSMQGSINYNLIPFRSMSTQIKYITQWWALKNLLGNIIPFIPFGFLLPIAYKKFSSMISIFFTGLASILLIEIFQFLTKLGTFDVDDIILNMIGIVCGYLMFLVIKRLFVRDEVMRGESKAETQVHGALKAAYYDAFRAARQEMNSGVAGMEVQGGFDARA